MGMEATGLNRQGSGEPLLRAGSLSTNRKRQLSSGRACSRARRRAESQPGEAGPLTLQLNPSYLLGVTH